MSYYDFLDSKTDEEKRDLIRQEKEKIGRWKTRDGWMSQQEYQARMAELNEKMPA